MVLPMISGKRRILLRVHIILKMIFWWQPETLPNVILLERIILRGTTDLALAIFDSMKKVHGMGDRERLLLQIAVQLHDCGKYISMGDVAECSYQIIMATEIIGLSTEERQIIANAVRHNTTEFVYYSEIAGEVGMDRSVYLLIAKLTAILRIANAMDRSHYQKVKNMKAMLKDRTLLLTVDSEQDISPGAWTSYG